VPAFPNERALDFSPAAVQFRRRPERLDGHHRVWPIDDQLVAVAVGIGSDLAPDRRAAPAEEVEHRRVRIGAARVSP
jgi:hypothetical protein